MAVFYGTKHDDNFNESSDTSSDVFDLYKGGNDTVIAGSGNDTFNMGAALNAGDRLDGGAGTDYVTLHGDYSAGLVFDDQTIQNIEVLRLRAGFDYNFTLADGNVASGAKLTINAASLGAGHHLTLDGSAETDGRFLVYASAGDDVLTGGANNDRFNLSNGGNDTVHGGGGNDLFVMGGAFTSADTIDGGTGNDTLEMGQSTGTITAVFNANTMQNVETLKIDGTALLTLNDGNVAAGATLTIDASAANAIVAVNGSAETNGAFHFIAGTGRENLTGGAGNDFFDMTLGSNGSVVGGGGNDTFLYAANYGISHVEGDTGSNTLEFDGAYSSLALGSALMSGIETVKFLGGHSDTGITVTGDIAAGGTLTIDASAASNFAIDLSAATSAAYAITGSGGDDTIKYGANFFSTSDTFDGGAGNDTLELNFLNAGNPKNFTANTISNVETIKLDQPMWIVLNDGNVASGQTLTVLDATTNAGGNTVDGSAETNGSFHFIAEQSGGPDTFKGGAGNDLFDMGDNSSPVNRLFGNGGNDTFSFNAHLGFNNIISGGTGSDTLELNGDYTTLTLRGDATHITSVETLKFLGGHSYTGLTITGDVADGSTLTIDAGAASNIAIDLTAATSSAYAITGSGGDDTVKYGANFFSTSDTFDGGAGSDTLEMHGDYSGGYTFGAAQLTSVETLKLDDGFSYKLTTNDGNVATGATMTVDASALTGTNALTFDGSAEQDGNFNFLFGANFTSNDVITGGAGNNTLSVDGDYSSADLTISDAQVTNVETLDFLAKMTGNKTTFITGDIAGGHTLDIDVALTTTRFFLDLSGATSAAYDITSNDILSTVTFGGNFSSTDKYHNSSDRGVLRLNGDYSGGLILSGANIGGLQELDFNGDFSYSASVVGKIGQTGANGFINLKSNVSAGHSVFLDLTQSTAGNLDVNHIGAGDLTVKFAGNFSSNDQISAAAGATTLELDGDYSAGLSFVNLVGPTKTLNNVTTLKLDDGFSYKLAMDEDNGGATLTVDATALTAGHTLTFDGSGDSSSLAITGGAGDDMVKFSGNFAAADTFNGGAGNDTLELNGDYSGGYTFGAAQLTSVETLKLDDGFSYKLTTDDGNVATGATLTVDASALTGANALTFDGSAENGGFYAIKGGAGADSVTFGSHYSVSDTFNGGAGSDTLTLSDIHGSYTFADTTMTNVETLAIFSNIDNSFAITTTDANVAAGATLTVDYSATNLSEIVTFDGSAEQDGHFAFIVPEFAGTIVTFTGGALSDSFALPTGDGALQNNFNGGGGDDTLNTTAVASSVNFNGGTGNDTVALTGGGTESYIRLTLTSVEAMTLDDNDWTIAMGTGHGTSGIAPGDTLNVNATALSGGHTLAFDASGVVDGGAFVFTFGGNFSASDSLTGGAGSDTLSLNGDYSSVIMTASTITSIETITVADGHSYDLAENDANVASGATLTVDGSALTGGNTLTFGGSAELDGHFAFIGGAGADVLEGGSQSDTFDLSRSDGAFVNGGGGNDTFTVTSRAFLLDDFIDGGTGSSDTLVLNGDFSTQTNLTGGNLANIDALQLLGGSNSYNLNFFDGVTAALSVDASAAASLTFSGAGDTTTAFTITGSAGDDQIIGGNKGDIFTGGGGADTFIYTSVAQSTSTHYDTITDFGATDSIDITGGVPTFSTAGTEGTYQGSLDNDLTDFFANLGAGKYGVVTLTGDTDPLKGHVFLVIDGDGNMGYAAGADYVIDITGSAADPSLIHFV